MKKKEEYHEEEEGDALLVAYSNCYC